MDDTGLLSLLLGTGILADNPADHALEVASCTVADLFNQLIPYSTIRGELTIPEYQRPYIWREKEVLRLLDDLYAYFNTVDETLPLYYLGSIILHQQNNKLNIIDGQQRITTLAILQSFFDAGYVENISYVHPISVQNIVSNSLLIKKAIAEYNGFNKFDLSRINITLVVTHNEDDAYTFFETQNTGGVRLSGVDIIKAHHLRELTSERSRSQYASIWESQKEVAKVVEYLLKARKWGFLNWVTIPSHRDKKNTKELIIKEFSEKTLASTSNRSYQIVEFNNEEHNSGIRILPYRFSIRQPVANGKNFIEYLQSFCDLHERLFINKTDNQIDDVFYKFQTTVIEVNNGTSYLQDFYEIAMLCYTHRFGTRDITEAAYWIFRFTYSLRVSNEKTVRENSIPAFLRSEPKTYLFDHILSSFSHKQLISKLKKFSYEVDSANCEEHKVKGRFVKSIQSYFKFTALKYDEKNKPTINDYDSLLQKQ